MSINILPIELKKEILGFLGPKDQASLACVDKNFNQIVQQIYQEKMTNLIAFIEDCDKQLQKITEGKERLITLLPKEVIGRGWHHEFTQRIVSSIFHTDLQKMRNQTPTYQFYSLCREKVIDALADCRFVDLDRIKLPVKSPQESVELLEQAKNTVKGSLFLLNAGSGGFPNHPYALPGVTIMITSQTYAFNRENGNWGSHNYDRVIPFFGKSFPVSLPSDFLCGKKEGDAFYIPQPPGVPKSELRIKLVCDQMHSPYGETRFEDEFKKTY